MKLKLNRLARRERVKYRQRQVIDEMVALVMASPPTTETPTDTQPGTRTTEVKVRKQHFQYTKYLQRLFMTIMFLFCYVASTRCQFDALLYYHALF